MKCSKRRRYEKLPNERFIYPERAKRNVARTMFGSTTVVARKLVDENDTAVRL
jgi:hypothetical protein